MTTYIHRVFVPAAKELKKKQKFVCVEIENNGKTKKYIAYQFESNHFRLIKNIDDFIDCVQPFIEIKNNSYEELFGAYLREKGSYGTTNFLRIWNILTDLSWGNDIRYK